MIATNLLAERQINGFNSLKFEIGNLNNVWIYGVYEIERIRI